MLKDILRVLLETGLSLDECVEMKWNDVYLKNHRLAVRARVIPLTRIVQQILGFKSPEAAGYVFTRGEKDKLQKEELINELENLKQKLRLSDKVNFAAFRHAFVRNLLFRGVHLVKIYQILGFKDIGRLAYYLPLLEKINIV